MASASIFVMNLDKETYTENSSPMLSHINVGTGTDVTIKELAVLIKEAVCFKGEILFDPSQPDGTPRKLLNVGKISKLGWEYDVNLKDGLARTYEWFLKSSDRI